jgi:hypothetical protein
VWTKEKDGRAADTIHQQCKKNEEQLRIKEQLYDFD